MGKKVFLQIASGLLILVGLWGCAEQKQASQVDNPQVAEEKKAEPIVLAVAGPFTGDSSEFGVQIKMAVELAAEELNKAGGVNGRPIQLQLEDDAGNPADAQNVATKIASNPKVVAVIGHFNSSCSLAAKGAYTEAKLVMPQALRICTAVAEKPHCGNCGVPFMYSITGFVVTCSLIWS